MTAPKAILSIMPEPPQNPGIGGALRMYWIIRGVREALPGTRHFGVAALDSRFAEGVRRAAELFDELHWVGSESGGAEDAAGALFSRLSPSEFAYAASWWLPYLRPLLRKCVEVLDAHPEIEVIHLDHLNLAPIALWLRRYTRAPIAVTAHNTYSLLAGAPGSTGTAAARVGRRVLGLAASAAQLTPAVWYNRPREALAKAAARLSARVDLGRVSVPVAAVMDAWYAAKADLVLCMSEQEAALLSQMGNRTFVAPNGASASFLAPVLEARRKLAATPLSTPVFGFVGAASYPPYQTACELLLQAFAEAPELGRLRLVGYHMGKHVPLLPSYAACRNATVVDSPPELRPYLIDLDAMVMPIFSGGGTRLKVVESVFAGIPLIASRKAVEGLDLDVERDCALIEEPTAASVASAVRKFLAGRAYYEERVLGLREAWLGRYDWLSVGARVAGALGELRASSEWTPRGVVDFGLSKLKEDCRA